MTRLLISIVFCCYLLLCGCAHTTQDGPPHSNVDVSQIPNATPRPLPKSHYGNPKSYVVNGKRYSVLNSAVGYNQRGIASWYGTKFDGRLTSTHETYNMLGMTAASPVLPLPTFVRVTNLRNGRQIIVKVNDRGPFVKGRIIDLTYVGAKKLGYIAQGSAPVQVTAITPGQSSPTSSFTHWAENRINRTPTAKETHPTVPASPSSSGLYLQLGAFHDWQHAQTLKQKIQHIITRPVIIAKGVYHMLPIYRVRVGPITNKDTYEQLKNKLQSLL